MTRTDQAVSAVKEAPPALSFAELAARWGVTRQTLYNMLASGELRSFKVRDCRRVAWSEVQRIEQGEAA
jgi:excisionase family DNA binding protein